MNKNSKTQNSPFEPIDPDYVNPQYPVDSAAERSLVGALLDAPQYLPEAVIQLGGPEAMGNEAYGLILTTLLELYTENKPIKLSSVLQSLNKAGKTELLIERGVNLIDLQKEAHSADWLETCLYLRSLWIKRTAADGAQQILSAVAANETVDQIVDKSARMHECIAGGLSIAHEKTNADFVAESLHRLDQVMQNSGALTGIDTGLSKLNKHLGGWQDSDVIMVAGRPGMGKSIMGVFFAYHAAKSGIPVAFLSLEMPARSLINRLISLLTGVPYGDIMKGFISQEQAQKIHRAAGEIEKLPIHWYDEAERDISDLSYLLLNWKKKHKIGFAVVDYVQLTEDRTVRSTDEYQIQTSVSKKYKKLQRRLKIPLMELGQLGRAVEGRPNRRPKQSDLRTTGQYEQDASLIMMLFRPDYYAEEDAIAESEKSGKYVTPERNHVLEAGIVKNRDGYTGTIKLHCDVATNQVFDNPPPPEPISNSFPVSNLNKWPKPTTDTPF